MAEVMSDPAVQFAVGPDRLDHLEPAEPRHHHVEDEQRRTALAHGREGSLAVTHRDHVVARAPEPQRHQRQDVLVVVRTHDDRARAHAKVCSGSSTTKVVPSPAALATPMRPPCASTIAFEM